jgi:transposase InsO family protein
MAAANPTWGAPRIHGELRKLGITIAESTVARYLPKRRPHRPPSQTWRTFLRNHMKTLVAIDSFVVPTATFSVLYVFLVLDLERRRILHWNVTQHPTSRWLGQQIVNAFPWDSAPPYLLRDRDGGYGEEFRRRLRGLGLKEVLTAPRSPWQNAFVERVIGSVRRECLDHVVVISEGQLRRLLREYVDYYHESRTHLSLGKDCPEPRAVDPPENGTVVALPQVGGLHHRYLRRAA